MEVYTRLFLQFWIQNNGPIIQWLTLALLLVLLYWLISIYFRPSELQTTNGGTALKQEKSQFPVHRGGGMEAWLAVDELRRELQEREDVIESLKEQLKKRPPPGDPKRVKILEEKLAEYEVIKEDIVNLPRYREEIRELKAKLNELTHQ